jgi:hypothetical protein
MKIISTQQIQHVRGGVVILVIGTIAGLAGTLSGLFYHMTSSQNRLK